MRPNVRTALTSSAAWLIGAATSVGVALIALSLIGDGLSTHGVSPLTPGRAETMAASDGPATTTTRPPSTSASPTSSTNATGPATPARGQILRSSGGFVVATCTGGDTYLVSWVPEQGYEARDVHRGPAAMASVEFERSRRHVQLTVTCAGGVAQAQVATGEDDGLGHD